MKKHILLALLLFSSPAQASSFFKECILRELNARNLSDIDYSDWVTPRTKRVVTLADGNRVRVAEGISARHPGVKVYKTDYSITRTANGVDFPNVKWMHADNTKRLPFADNFADLIVMREGLCLCGRVPGQSDNAFRNRLCGAGNLEFPVATAFLEELARVLNKENPDAEAHLGGRDFYTPEDVLIWKDASAAVMQIMHERGTPVAIVPVLNQHGEFQGISMRARPRGQR